MEIKKQLISINYTKGGNKPKYIVIHNTDNKTANAQTHFKYWNTNKEANSSAHYVVDDKEVIKLVNHEDMAWHNGKKYGTSTHPECNNNNSIGIEICNHTTCDFDKSMENAIELVKILMSELGIKENMVITHKNSCAKNCPSTILKLNKWEWFKEQITTTNENKEENINKEEDTQKNTYYRVVVGSYSKRENAESMVKELENEGYKPFVDVYTK